MTKRVITIIIIISALLANLAYSQGNQNMPMIRLDQKKLVVLYDLEYRRDTLSLNDVYSEPMLLQIGDNQSKFSGFWREYRDSIINASDNMQQYEELSSNPETRPPSPRIHYIIFKNYTEKTITHNEMILPDMYRYQEPIELFDWQITDEKKKWLKYTLQKATTEFGGRSWEAWFTTDIPISDGPYKFNGLPGLIVIARDTKDHYVFKMRSIYTPKEDAYIEMYKEMRFIDTDKKGFVRAYNYFRHDVFERAKNAGLDSPEVLQTIAENIKKRNNPIELIFD